MQSLAMTCNHKGYAYLIQRTSSAAEMIVPSPNCSLLYRDKLSLIWLRKGKAVCLDCDVLPPACFIPMAADNGAQLADSTSFLDALSCCIAESCTTRMDQNGKNGLSLGDEDLITYMYLSQRQAPGM